MDDLISRSELLDICEQQGHVDVDDLVMEPCETNEKYATIMAFNKLRLKVGFTRLCELLQAEVEGRCVVLPCKPSDVTVYQLRSKKHAKGVGISPRHVGSTSVWGEGRYALHHQGLDDCLDSGLGKTWFLTKEEAEAALKGENHEADPV